MLSERNVGLLTSWLTDKKFYDASRLQNGKELSMDADERALKLFHDAAHRVPAYKDFLSKNAIDTKVVRTIEDFKKVPIITKKNYIDSYSTKDRSWDGNMNAMHMISTSSGSTGEPYYWSRDLLSEIEGAYFHEFIYKNNYHADKKSTLFINGFAMGTWIASTFTMSCTNLVAWKGFPITSITPGYDVEPILKILTTIADQFEQVIICGFVPFLKEIVELANERNINLKKLNIYLLGTGQGITENWRSYVQSQMTDAIENKIFNIYGSADTAIMAVEIPLSVQIRKIIDEKRIHKTEIFGTDRLPSLYVYDPRLTYFEQINGELHITKNSGCPLIRYNMYDEGGILTHSEMMQHFPHMESLQDYVHRLPFVYLFGRDKFMVKMYGANIYTEHVQQALGHASIQKFISGKYLIDIVNNEKQDPIMQLHIELNHNIEKTEQLAQAIKDIFITEITKINSEYREVVSRMKEKVHPKVILYDKDDPIYFPKGKVKKTS